MFPPGKPPSRIMKAAADRDPMPPPTRLAFDFVPMSFGSSEKFVYVPNAIVPGTRGSSRSPGVPLVAAKHVQVGGVHLSLAADERGFAVAGSKGGRGSDHRHSEVMPSVTMGSPIRERVKGQMVMACSRSVGSEDSAALQHFSIRNECLTTGPIYGHIPSSRIQLAHTSVCAVDNTASSGCGPGVVTGTPARLPGRCCRTHGPKTYWADRLIFGSDAHRSCVNWGLRRKPILSSCTRALSLHCSPKNSFCRRLSVGHCGSMRGPIRRKCAV